MIADLDVPAGDASAAETDVTLNARGDEAGEHLVGCVAHVPREAPFRNAYCRPLADLGPKTKNVSSWAPSGPFKYPQVSLDAR